MQFLYNETTLTSSGSIKALRAVVSSLRLGVWNACFSCCIYLLGLRIIKVC